MEKLSVISPAGAEAVEQKIRAAQKDGRLAAAGAEELGNAALAAGAITAEEHALLRHAARLRNEAIRVDEYTQRRFVFFVDPDGLPLELYEAGPAPEA